MLDKGHTLLVKEIRKSSMAIQSKNLSKAIYLQNLLKMKSINSMSRYLATTDFDACQGMILQAPSTKNLIKFYQFSDDIFLNFLCLSVFTLAINNSK